MDKSSLFIFFVFVRAGTVIKPHTDKPTIALPGLKRGIDLTTADGKPGITTFLCGPLTYSVRQHTQLFLSSEHVANYRTAQFSFEGLPSGDLSQCFATRPELPASYFGYLSQWQAQHNYNPAVGGAPILSILRWQFEVAPCGRFCPPLLRSLGAKSLFRSLAFGFS